MTDKSINQSKLECSTAIPCYVETNTNNSLVIKCKNCTDDTMICGDCILPPPKLVRTCAIIPDDLKLSLLNYEPSIVFKPPAPLLNTSTSCPVSKIQKCRKCIVMLNDSVCSECTLPPLPKLERTNAL